jgi:FMN phosphatase YigB (HAD superfamily)
MGYPGNGMIKGIIFDFNWTLYDGSTGGPIEGALELLQGLQDRYKLCLISCLISGISEQERLRQIQQMGLIDLFDLVIISPQEKTQDTFEECLREMELQATDVAVIGDRLVSEIAIGNRLGAVTIWFRYGKYAHVTPSVDIEIPQHTISKLSELMPLLEKLDTQG